MGKKLEKNIKRWPEQEAILFLDFLKKEIGETEALKRIKSTSYLWSMNWLGFKNAFDFYKSYIGEEQIRERLKNTLAGFYIEDIEETREVVKFIEKYWKRRSQKQNEKKP